MRYFSYNEYTETEFSPDDSSIPPALIVTVSEEEIRRDYYPYWYEKMCTKFGKTAVDQTYSFEDCLDDWIVVNWAWEVKDAEQS